MDRRGFLRAIGKAAVVAPIAVLAPSLVSAPKPLPMVTSGFAQVGNQQAFSGANWTTTGTTGTSNTSYFMPVTAIRGEDYPSLAAIWENDEDAIYDDMEA